MARIVATNLFQKKNNQYTYMPNISCFDELNQKLM